ncbi:MAG: hypothetical protein BWX45_01006 [Deltaproteobacteria bacterium ADurb.Bin002]|nr:MAG: hypothetical protein BWX45_01006 [Deltaproteobacteria bacterium ADurb.Bin002]
MILHNFHTPDDIRIDGPGPRHGKIAIGAIPVFQGRISHFNGRLIHSPCTPLPQDGGVQDAVLGEHNRCNTQKSTHKTKHPPRQRQGEIDPLQAMPAQPFHFRRIVRADSLNAVENNRFEFLDAHDGTQTRSGGDPALVAANAGNQGNLLARRADDGHGRFGAVLLFERFFRLDGIASPEVRCVFQRRFAVFYIQIDGAGADASEENGVIAAMLDGRRKGAAAVCVAPATGQRRFSHQRPAAGKQTAGSREKSRTEPEDVVRAQRIGAGGHPVVQNIRAQPHPGQILFIHPVGDFFFRHGPVGQIHHEDFSHVRFVHEGSFSFISLFSREFCPGASLPRPPPEPADCPRSPYPPDYKWTLRPAARLERFPAGCPGGRTASPPDL